MSNEENENSKCVGLNQAKSEIRTSLLNLKVFEEKYKLLKEKVESTSEDEWKQNLKIVESLKTTLSATLAKYTHPDTIKSLQQKIKIRKSKRLRIKRRRHRYQQQRQRNLQHRKQLHKSLDQWLENEAQKQLQIKRNKDAADYAKTVLSNVTEKKSNAKNYLRLFASLKELRRLRRVQRTDSDSGEVDFNSRIDRLLDVWKDALNEYEIEETRLRSILSETHKSIEDRWLEIFFGTVRSEDERFLSQQTGNLNRFLDIRRTWDTCIVPENCEFGSHIPNGWILPPENPSPAWAAYRK